MPFNGQYTKEERIKLKQILCHHEREGTDSDDFKCIHCGKYIKMSYNK